MATLNDLRRYSLYFQAKVLWPSFEGKYGKEFNSIETLIYKYTKYKHTYNKYFYDEKPKEMFIDSWVEEYRSLVSIGAISD